MGAKRGLRGFEPEDDRTVLTYSLTREELGILFDGIKKHRIKQTRLKLNALRKKKVNQDHRSRAMVERLPVIWRKVKKTNRKQIDGWQQKLPLF